MTSIRIRTRPTLPPSNVNWLILVLASLATFRLTELIAVDDGPFRMFRWWRGLWKRRPILHELFTCIYCVSGYVSLGACWYLWQGGYVAPIGWLLYWPAIWGGSVAVFRLVRER